MENANSMEDGHGLDKVQVIILHSYRITDYVDYPAQYTQIRP